MSALDTFRNPPAENLDISIEPQLFNFAAQPVRADFVANNGYFNNLSVIGNPAGTQNNSLTTNFITPVPFPGNVPPYFGDYHLGIYGVADGTNNQAVIFDLYESILNPGQSVQFGVGQFTKFAICSTPPNGPFVITTSHSSVGGQNRGILIAPELVLQLGSNTTARWDIQTGSGNLVPTSGQSCEVGAPTNPTVKMHSFEYDVYNFSFTILGKLMFDNTANGMVLMMNQCTGVPPSPGAGKASLFITAGTNGGTLKLAIKAGAAGAVTTILDNIPQ